MRWSTHDHPTDPSKFVLRLDFYHGSRPRRCERVLPIDIDPDPYRPAFETMKIRDEMMAMAEADLAKPLPEEVK